MIKWNQQGLYNVNRKLAFALNKTSNDTISNINQARVVPYHIGTLERSATVILATPEELISGISWNTPYARRLYLHPEYNFRNNRKGEWAKDWVTGGKKQWIQKAFVKNMRGAI